VNKIVCIIVLASGFLPGCAFVEMSGKMTHATGEVMTEYSKNHTGFIAKGAGVGGKINTAVGKTVEGIGKKGESDADDSKGKQFVDANKQVMKAAVHAVKNDESVNVRAQKRLQALGYDVGTEKGTIGPKTKIALGNYQKKNGLQITHALDGPTVEALEKHP
jgi:hypothetical protein